MIEQAIRDTMPPVVDTSLIKSGLLDSLLKNSILDSTLDSNRIQIKTNNFDSLWKNLQNNDRKRFPGFNMNFNNSDSMMQVDSTMLRNFQNMRMQKQD